MTLLEICLPQKFYPETKYTFEILLEEFLDLSCSFRMDAGLKDFEIRGPGLKTIIIKNQFFIRYEEPEGYIRKEAIPGAIMSWSDPEWSLKNLPVIYGEGILEDTREAYVLHADLIASTYFMLSRWEEVVDDQKDEHDRSTASLSLAFRYQFLDRPVVNEYADLLWLLLLKAGYVGKRKHHMYTPVVTHDVDQPYQWPDWYTSLKHLGGDLLKRRDLRMFSDNLGSLVRTRFFNQPDPFDQHQYMLDLAERYGLKVYFNFLISRSSRNDEALSSHDHRLVSLIRSVEDAGHTIGFHPGYNRYLEPEPFNQELAELQNLVRQKIKSGRQHFLRFRVPFTWRLWDQAGFEWESSLAYSGQPGFRCGTCYTFTVYDCLERKKLRLREKPLLLMDATLVFYQKKPVDSGLTRLKDQCKKHGGEWVTLWHNNLVHHPLLNGFEELIYT